MRSCGAVPSQVGSRPIPDAFQIVRFLKLVCDSGERGAPALEGRVKACFR